MRDICRVIDYVLKEVIPEDQPIRPAVLEIGQDATYTPPEIQAPHWLRLAQLLDRQLGDPAGTPWKERLAAIMAGKEPIPDQESTQMAADLDPSPVPTETTTGEPSVRSVPLNLPEDKPVLSKRVLIVWSEIPEKLATLIVMVVSDHTAEKLRRFHDHYINVTDPPDDTLNQEMNDFFHDPNDGSFKFNDYVTEEPLSGQFDLIIRCGIVL